MAESTPKINIDIVAVRTFSVSGNGGSLDMDVDMEDVKGTHYKKQKSPRNDQVFIPGDLVMDNAEGWMDGHGSYCSVQADRRVEMLASVAGVRQIFTRVVVINPLKSRYAGEIGDIVVGRIVQVGRKSWTVSELSCLKDALIG